MTGRTVAIGTREPFRRACRWCCYAWGAFGCGFVLLRAPMGFYGAGSGLVLLLAGILFACTGFVFSLIGLLCPGGTRRPFFLIPAVVSGIPAGFVLLFLLPARHMAPRLETLRAENPYRRSPAIFYYSRQSPPSPAALSALVDVLSAKNLSEMEWREIAKCVAKYGGLAEKAAILSSLHGGLGQFCAYDLSYILPSYDAEFDVAMRGAFRTSTEAGKEGMVAVYAKWGDQGVAGLCSLLRSSSADRVIVVKYLGATHSPRAIPVLRQAMGDPDGWVRTAAVGALADIGGPAARETIIWGLADRNPKVAQSAAWCASHLATQEVVPSLVRLGEESTDKETRRAVAFALRSIAQNAKTDPQVAAQCRQALQALTEKEWVEVRERSAKRVKDTR